MNELINKIDSFLIKAKKYIQPEKGEKPPKGVSIKRGPREGTYYETAKSKISNKAIKLEKKALEEDLREFMEKVAEEVYEVLSENGDVSSTEIGNTFEDYMPNIREVAEDLKTSKDKVYEAYKSILPEFIRRMKSELRESKR